MPDSRISFPRLNLPACPLRKRNEDGLLKVFDPLREKYVALTPEEFVRQHFVSFLTSQLNYPRSLMANEVSIRVNDMHKRCDTVVYTPEGQTLMIVEYKAPDVRITQEVFDQIVRYNLTLRSRYLVVSNGMNHYCAVMDYRNNTYNFIPSIPDYNDLRHPFSIS